MAEPPDSGDSGTPAEGASTALEGGAYDLIKQRLTDQAKVLRERLGTLDEQRAEVFGTRKLELKKMDRVSTQLNCEPRDMIQLGHNRFLFGFNVNLGLKQGQLSDVFSVFEYDAEAQTFHEGDLTLLQDEHFKESFSRLFKIDQSATFHRFAIIGVHLYMVFRTGKMVDDVTVFKWLYKDGELVYEDDRSAPDYLRQGFPGQYNFQWKTPASSAVRHGDNPHVSIEDRVFVECVGGDLTIKVEDNTATGEGIYAEEVVDANQKVGDAEIQYAIQGSLILLKMTPYREKQTRYFIFNEKLQAVHRVDTLGQSCVMLPEEHGLIFPDGYYLQTGELKRYEGELGEMVLERTVSSPNGEDFLYVFFNRMTGLYALMPYRLIEQEVTERITCHGFSLFPNGDLVSFRAEEEAIKHHTIQLRQTPFYQPGFEPESGNRESFLYQVGNKSVVRAMAECNEVLILIQKESPYADLYADVARRCESIPNSYAWLTSGDGGSVVEILKEIGSSAEKAIAEFDKVRRLRLDAKEKADEIQKRAKTLFNQVLRADFRSVDDFVANLGGLRRMRGEIITLKDEVRFINTAAMDSLEAEVKEQVETLSQSCVQFLLQPEALDPYRERADEQRSQVEGVTKMAEAKELNAEITQAGEDLEMLIDIVRSLQIDDTTEQTRIIESITAIYQVVNQVKEALKNKSRTLMSAEGAAQFNAQILLLSQTAVNYLDMSDSPEKCDGYFNNVINQLEDLGGDFADFPEYIEQLDEKRGELEAAFEQKRLQLEEARNRKATALVSSAERMLKSVEHKLGTFDDVNDINGYMAADRMIDSIRERVKELTELEKAGEAEGIQSQLKSIHEEAVRQLKDKKELYVDGQNVIQFGKHKFAVNTQPLDLTIVRRGDEQNLHLTGTQYFDPIEDEAFLATREVWEQQVISEDREIYRAEYLAYLLWQKLEHESGERLAEVAAMKAADRLKLVQDFMGDRYAEAYTKGIHDQDAAKILAALLNTHAALQLARYHPRVRACGAVYWHHFCPEDTRKLWAAKLEGFAKRNELFPGDPTQREYIVALQELVAGFVTDTVLFPEEDAAPAGEYLFYEITNGKDWAVSQEADQLLTEFERHLVKKGSEAEFDKAQKPLKANPHSHYQLVRDWVRGFLLTRNGENKYLEEVAALIFCGHHHKQAVVKAATAQAITGLQGAHDAVQEGSYDFDYLVFQEKLGRFARESVPRFEQYQELKQKLIEDEKEVLRLHEFEPRVLSSFVRNQLVDTVYLPIVGDNLAKQIGVTGEGKRTDLMGLLLLISPPGYGKTTLMEYLANRMGLIFMKINGPALGHEVGSLDPEDAPNAGARAEVNKLNLALEMGDNVMIYLDDIQHCNPEFLQKFISLCDAQRKIEGVWRGQPKTYDMRGRRVVVVMAGNPYTESGEKFRIPDMLANRADTYNLGDDMKGREEAFNGSYIENAITSNPVLQPLAKAAQKDIQAFIRMAETGQREGIELQGSYSANETEELLNVLKKLTVLRDVVLKVNQLYIESAGQADEFRTEPAFKMQGSYRNMNRLAEKVLAIMNDQELMDLVLDHYKGESQTLTTGAEANFLKFKQLIGVMTEDEEARWEDIKKTYGRNQFLQGGDQGDPVSRVVSQLSLFTGGLDAIQGTLKEELSKPRTTQLDLGGMNESLDALRDTISQHLSGQQTAAPTPTEGTVPSDATNENLTALRGAFEKYLEQSSTAAAATQESQSALADRQMALAEFIEQSNVTLADTIRDSQSQTQANQMQAALSKIGVLFANYQERHRELRERLDAAQPTEVVVDVSQDMVQDSDALIQQLLAQLQEAQQQEPPADSKGG
ncbi:MAG: DNA repair ATPase [Verrucomicrobia subdivision 3 bacterium]|nr:DNA repair ATPase [Limisphaerales bacterium]